MNELVRGCPYCGTTLSFSNHSFRCGRCNIKFKKIDGIWRFTDSSYSYSDFLNDQDLRSIKSENWERELQEVFEKMPLNIGDATYRRIFDATRAAWKVLGNLNPEGYVLDIGCGYGAITRSLAPHFKQCVAMDLSLGRLKLAQVITSGLEIRNVEFIHGGDTPLLPFDDNKFDLVVLNAVLEWIPVTYTSEKPWDAQLDFLREILRILRPGGCVYIASENRFAWKYWLGIPEDHIGLPFIALLPRSLADWYAKLVKRKPYRTHTYSIFGYKKLLLQSGFNTIHFFSLVPTHRHFSYIFDLSRPLSDEELKSLDPRESCSWRRKLERFALRCIARGKLLSYLTHSLGIIASKSRECSSFIESLKQQEGFDKLLSMRVTGGHNISFVFERNGRKYFVKAPLTSIGHTKLQIEQMNTEKIRKLATPSVANAIPLLQVSEISGIKYYVSEFYENLINGKEAVSKSGDVILRIGLEWLAEFLRCSERKVTVSEDLFDMLIGERIDFLLRNLMDAGLKDLLNRLRDFLRASLHGREVAVAYIHGDFRVENIFLDMSKVAKVIDWDHAGEFFPAVDKIEFYTSFILRRYSRIRGMPTVGQRLLIARTIARNKGWGELFSEVNLCLYWLYRTHLWVKWSNGLWLNPVELHDSKKFLLEMLKGKKQNEDHDAFADPSLAPEHGEQDPGLSRAAGAGPCRV